MDESGNHSYRRSSGSCDPREAGRTVLAHWRMQMSPDIRAGHLNVEATRSSGIYGRLRKLPTAGNMAGSGVLHYPRHHEPLFRLASSSPTQPRSVAAGAAAMSPLANAQTAVAAPRTRGERHGLTDKTLQAVGANAISGARSGHSDPGSRRLKAQRQANRGARLEMARALAAATVDPSAAEAARQKMLGQWTRQANASCARS